MNHLFKVEAGVMSNSGSCRVFGKWILAGEHAILRGGSAVALPRPDLYLELNWTQETRGGIRISPPSAQSPIERLINALRDLPVWKNLLHQAHCQLTLTGTIPQGAGMGSSACLCVAFVKWLISFGPDRAPPLSEVEFLALATLLEDQFHGKSSGIDIATVYYGQPLCVQLVRERVVDPFVAKIRKLHLRRLPRFTFYDTHIRSSTQSCVEKVASAALIDPNEARAIDLQMSSAAVDAEKALFLYAQGSSEEGSPQGSLGPGLALLADAMARGQDCFRRWGLVPDAAQALEESLLAQGALAVKLTGSGGGGMMVALWSN